MSPTAKVNPNALTVEQLAKLLQVAPAVLRGHLDEGAPSDPQGRVHLVEYVAWLVSRLHRPG